MLFLGLFLKNRWYFQLFNDFPPFFCKHCSLFHLSSHIKTERSPLEFLTLLHNRKLSTKSRLYISVTVPWQTFTERSLGKEMVLELAVKIRR